MVTLGSKVVMFGGYDAGTTFSDTWTFDGTAWTEQSIATPPRARYLHAMATLGGKVVMFGDTT